MCDYIMTLSADYSAETNKNLLKNHIRNSKLFIIKKN